MRSTELEQNLLAIESYIQKAVIKANEPAEETLVLAALATKCHSHCRIARELISSGATGEAVIVLRAAYEATILGLYLQQHPDRIRRYLTYSALTTLRCQLELLKILQSKDTENSGEHDQLAYIARQKQTIIDMGLLNELKLKPEDLDEWEKIKRYSNSAHFIKFEDLRSGITKDENTQVLFETAYQVYNLGSQMAHSNFDLVDLMIYKSNSHPLYSDHSLYRQIFTLLGISTIILSFCKLLSEEDSESIKQSCRAASF